MYIQVYRVSVGLGGGSTMLDGVQFGLFNRTYYLNGIMAGVVNIVSERTDGLELGAVNVAPQKPSNQSTGRGIQIGVFIVARKGWQLGFMNYNTEAFLSFTLFLNFS